MFKIHVIDESFSMKNELNFPVSIATIIRKALFFHHDNIAYNFIAYKI